MFFIEEEHVDFVASLPAIVVVLLKTDEAEARRRPEVTAIVGPVSCEPVFLTKPVSDIIVFIVYAVPACEVISEKFIVDLVEAVDRPTFNICITIVVVIANRDVSVPVARLVVSETCAVIFIYRDVDFPVAAKGLTV